jgi:hypothetical protein
MSVPASQLDMSAAADCCPAVTVQSAVSTQTSALTDSHLTVRVETDVRHFNVFLRASNVKLKLSLYLSVSP